MQQFFALKVYEWRAQLEINGPKEFLYHREMRPIKFFAGLHYERKLEERVKQGTEKLEIVKTASAEMTFAVRHIDFVPSFLFPVCIFER